MSEPADDRASQAAERVARESYGRLIAFLAARTRDLAGAEDALAEAFATALRLWPRDGVPANPDAWLLTVARRRQTDAVRRHHTRKAGEEHLQLMADEIDAAAQSDEHIPDRRLALMFACAHPEIERGMRAPLILQTILGMTAHDIAAAFLVPPATMGQRLVRAKARIKDAGIPFGIPEREDLPERLDAVLEAIYAAYGKGWGEVGEAGTSQLADEALWLARLVVQLMPGQPEAKGMLALMLYAQSRRAARRDPDGAYVPLDQQDTTLWDEWQIDLAETLLHQANQAGPSGRYQIEAAIQSAHTARRLSGRPNWPAIVALYDHLLTLTNSPVVALNRAAALAERDGPAPALAEVRAIAADKRLADYQPYWATRGHLAARAGDKSDAYQSFTVAIGLSTTPPSGNTCKRSWTPSKTPEILFFSPSGRRWRAAPDEGAGSSAPDRLMDSAKTPSPRLECFGSNSPTGAEAQQATVCGPRGLNIARSSRIARPMKRSSPLEDGRVCCCDDAYTNQNGYFHGCE